MYVFVVLIVGSNSGKDVTDCRCLRVLRGKADICDFRRLEIRVF